MELVGLEPTTSRLTAGVVCRLHKLGRGTLLIVVSSWLLVVRNKFEITTKSLLHLILERRIAQVKEAFFTPLQVAERVGIEPTIRVSIERFQFVCFFRQGAIALIPAFNCYPRKLVKLVHFGALPLSYSCIKSSWWESNPLPPRYQRKCVYASQVGAREKVLMHCPVQVEKAIAQLPFLPGKTWQWTRKPHLTRDLVCFASRSLEHRYLRTVIVTKSMYASSVGARGEKSRRLFRTS